MFVLFFAAQAASPSAAGHVTLTEFQADTARVPQYYGEWFELANNYPGTLDFFGVTITNSLGQSITIEDSILVGRGDYLVLGVSDNRTYGTTTYNGNVPVDYVYPFASFNFAAPADTLTVSYAGVTLDTVSWTSEWGVSLNYAHAASPNASALEWANDAAVNWCSSSTFITESGMYGSPGSANDYCGTAAGADDDGDGFSERDGDCRDDDPEVHPDAVDGNDGVPQSAGGGGNPDDDADCDGVRDDGVLDQDGDGYAPVDGDCDDDDDDAFPGAAELPDGVDNDCDDVVDERDGDGDGHEAPADCDDDDDGVFPGADEVPYDGVDQDCDGADADDLDGDGFVGEEADGTDCDDDDGAIHPGAAESCDGVDEDCDGTVDEDTPGLGTWYPDADGDGFGDGASPVEACEPPAATVADGTDCDDADPNRFPGNPEACDARDNDCDDATYDPLDCAAPEEDEGEEKAGGCACAAGAPSAMALVVFAGRRRRRRG